MLAFWRLTASHSTLNHFPLFGYVVEPTHFPQNTQHLNYHLPVLKNWPPLYAFVHSFPRFHSLGAMHVSADMAEKFDILNVCHSILGMNSYEKQSSIREVQSMHHTDSPDSISKEEKERQRRKKIGLANKGRVPWNKGRKHSSETCARIKQRTTEALKDPKVRKKMSEHPRPHSAESKAKMRSSLRRVWGQRLKWKRLREKLFLSWVESIAEAAKKGGRGQQELCWDSYEKIKQKLHLQELQLAAEKKKEKAKERTKQRATTAEQVKEKNMARIACERRKDGEVYEDTEELTVLQGRNCKQRLMKLERKTSTNGQVAARGDIVMSHISAFEKLDLELMKREKMQKEFSFADQIKAAKNKRMELTMEALSSVHAANKKPGEYA
ncbi:hypothetical protein PRUPE_4G170000 [Prunus persica]|uniref:Nuclease associated modular domain-containing protein n=1 Tax=Prunus persica TaxID=3760 RepID=A0A251PLR3_PRUPE|nr:uncharacterized protein LOC18780808 isoform X2 [Prunus persica]XP_020418469.1 uncharacterized protein LOC18780808 isoform X2 [Prunus persica]ONI12520.1 hypothetical protein PRUPE_4G170000 [Prunus persica]ONI12521.1 hypothetical protein PRUPE_4G170000 [Prunus persica]ONI12522.1 hypothetical protein PRUPE_4G170000 [Prunus persica]ONI12523.1 hypothetical protein PRUPE_4G170000 [Prunus persica]ONI12524.1 hypothetical protein PRUPE_4G170000 [Prunus persica]